MNNAPDNLTIGVLRIGWFGRLVAVLLSAALFLLVLVFGALVMAVVAAIVLVMGAKFWWLSRRAATKAGNHVGTTLDADYEIVLSDDADIDIPKQVKEKSHSR